MSGTLVTGARGFLGSHLLPLLAERGDDVHAVSRAGTPPGRDSRVCWHQADLLDPRQTQALLRLAAPERLVHLAWYTVPPAYWHAVDNDAWVRASIGLFRRFAEHGGRRMIGIGSCAEYDWHAGRCDEHQTPLSPASRYGRCKHQLHRLLSELAPAAGVELAWARIFFPYGPGEPPSKLVTHLATSLLRGVPAECTAPDCRRDFIYAGDAASALAALLASVYCGPVNIGTGIAVTVRDVAERVARHVGRPDLLRFAGSSEPQPPFPLVVADTRRLRDHVGWAPACLLDEGIARTTDYCRTRLH